MYGEKIRFCKKKSIAAVRTRLAIHRAHGRAQAHGAAQEGVLRAAAAPPGKTLGRSKRDFTGELVEKCWEILGNMLGNMFRNLVGIYLE